MKIISKRHYFSVLFLLTIQSGLLFSADDVVSELEKKQLEYYFRLQNEEFSLTMIPKEKYLLGLIKNVSEEIRTRQAEGVPVTKLGIKEVMTPEEVISEAYDNELDQINELLDEIEVLETRARKKVDINVLNLLGDLKQQVRLLIEGSITESEVSDFESVNNANESSNNTQQKEENSVEELRPEDLFDEWKYNRILDFKVKEAEYLFLRTKLLNDANAIQEKRMFQRDLKDALLNYSNGNFFLSRMQLQDILNTYTNYNAMSDVLYYAAESSYGLNYFDEALEIYQRIVQYSSDSEFKAKALLKSIYIYYTYDEVENVYSTYEILVALQSALDLEAFGTVSYLVGYLYFKAGHYSDAIQVLGKIPSESSTFFPSLYLAAACYANLGEDELALKVYYQLAGEREKSLRDPVVAQIRNNALLKLGLIYFERKQNDKAIYYFNQVSEEYEHYDLSVIGKAWSAYESGRPGEVLKNVEWLLRFSMASNYAYEAKVLAARSKELLGQTEEAVQDLKEIYQVGQQAEQVTDVEVENLIQNMDQVTGTQKASLDYRDQLLFEEVEQIRQFLQGGTAEPDAATASNGSTVQSKTTSRLEKEIEALDALEAQALAIEDTRLLRDIRQVRGSLIKALDTHTRKSSDKMIEPADDPLIRRMGMSEYLKYIFSNLLAESIREKSKTYKDINTADRLIQVAKQKGQFELSVRMEVKKEELEDYSFRLNQYEVWLRENFPQEFRIELDQWTRFSGYGISNINFSRIKETEARISQISSAIDEIDRVYVDKRKRLDRRIQSLLSDVEKIENQMQSEAEQRQQREREHFFKKEYFERQRKESMTGELKTQPGNGGQK